MRQPRVVWVLSWQYRDIDFMLTFRRLKDARKRAAEIRPSYKISKYGLYFCRDGYDNDTISS